MRVSNDVLAVLSTLEIDGPFVKIGEQLDRKLYTSVNKVLEACGGKWERRHQAHLFDGDARERIESVIVLGEVTTAKDLGFFPTPEPIAKQLVELADVQGGHAVLEPSAGSGAIAEWIIARGAVCYAIERDPRRRSALKSKRVLIHDWAAVHILEENPFDDDHSDDFMKYEADEPFDRVVMNPPFCKVGLGDHLDHVRHAFSMLVPSGVLVSVLPNGVLFRRDRRYREFREWIVELDGSMQALPAESFKASGTGVNTCVVRIRKAG